MIISTKKGTPQEELDKIVDQFEKQGQIGRAHV